MSDPTNLAERATVGALLADPRQLGTVASWLRPSDFAHWWHTEVYRALLRQPRLARRGDPVATAEHVRRVLVETLGHSRADPPALHGLMQAAPTRPVAARYAAMVVEASIRRQVAGLGVHLLAAAAADHGGVASRGPQETQPTSLRDLTGLVGPVLADLGAQWAVAVRTVDPASGELPEHGAPGGAGLSGPQSVLGVVDAAADERRVNRQRELAVVADRAVSAQPHRDPAAERRAQDQLVAALVSHPDQIERVAAWLRPEEVVRPTRPVYEALLALRQERVPIDPVTVTWEVHRASRARGPGPDPRDLLARIEAARFLHIHELTAAVARDTLARTAAHTADMLRAAAANPGLTVGDVLDAATWAADAVTRATAQIADVTPLPARTDHLATRTANEAPHTAGRSGTGARARWRRARHLSPVANGPDLSVL